MFAAPSFYGAPFARSADPTCSDRRAADGDLI
jgi:hypothetical protein